MLARLRGAAVALLVLALAWLRERLARLYHRLGAAEKRLGASRANAGLAQARLAACATCPLYTAAGFCRQCGCYMPVKAYIEQAKCPRGNW